MKNVDKFQKTQIIFLKIEIVSGSIIHYLWAKFLFYTKKAEITFAIQNLQ